MQDFIVIVCVILLAVKWFGGSDAPPPEPKGPSAGRQVAGGAANWAAKYALKRWFGS